MIRIEKSILINRTQQEVFDFASDPANELKWRDDLKSSEWTSEGPPGVGSTIRQVGRFLGREREGTGEVTLWDPPHQIGVKSTSGPIPFETANKLESTENGTLLTVNGQARPGGLFKLVRPLIVRQLEKQLDAQLEALKRLLEEGQG